MTIAADRSGFFPCAKPEQFTGLALPCNPAMARNMDNLTTQLYLISPLEVGGEFPQRLERTLAAGKGLVTAFQFRVKGLDQHEAARLAEPLQAICAAHDVAFIVNDSVALAKRLKADGVHLGQDDGSPADARTTGPRCADRRDLPRFAPHGDGSRRGGGRLCRLWRVLRQFDQGQGRRRAPYAGHP